MALRWRCGGAAAARWGELGSREWLTIVCQRGRPGVGRSDTAAGDAALIAELHINDLIICVSERTGRPEQVAALWKMPRRGEALMKQYAGIVRC